MDRSTPAFATYLADVSRLMLERYGISWSDACGEPEPIERALGDGDSAEEFVEWWAAKYELAAIGSRW